MNFTRNTNMVATLVATVLCGCPGLVGLCFGTAWLFSSVAPAAGVDVPGTSDPAPIANWEVTLLCLLSLIAIAMPAVVWFATRRKQTLPPTPSDNEPLPPAS